MGGPGSGRKKGDGKTIYMPIVKGEAYKKGQVGVTKRATGSSKQGRGYRFDVAYKGGKKYLGGLSATKWHFNLKGKKPLKFSKDDVYFVGKQSRSYYTD